MSLLETLKSFESMGGRSIGQGSWYHLGCPVCAGLESHETTTQCVKDLHGHTDTCGLATAITKVEQMEITVGAWKEHVMEDNEIGFGYHEGLQGAAIVLGLLLGLQPEEVT